MQKVGAEKFAEQIIKSRTPSSGEVQYDFEVGFLDPDHRLTREEIARVAALGDRTAISYKNLAKKVIADRGQEGGRRTADFFLAYALVARGSEEIAHTSVLQLVNAGPAPEYGDSPITVEGMSVLAALRDACKERYWSFEALSSRGAIFPENYWRIPRQLEEAGLGDKLSGVNSDVYDVYKFLTRRGLGHYLQTVPQKQGEEDWRYKWRVLSMALDDARQVMNLSFLVHFAGHPNDALALRESIVRHASLQLPETVEFGNRLRELVGRSLPTFTRYTEPSSFAQNLPERRLNLLAGLGVAREAVISAGEARSKLLSVQVSPDADRTFLAWCLAQDAGASVPDLYAKLRDQKDDAIARMVGQVMEGMTIHDKPPPGLERVRIMASYEMSIGALFEAIRHRPLHHVFGDFNSSLGYTVPKIYEDLGIKKEYEEGLALNRKGRELIRGVGGNIGRVFPSYFASRADLVHYSVQGPASEMFHMYKLRAHLGAHPDISEPMIETVKTLRKRPEAILQHIPVK